MSANRYRSLFALKSNIELLAQSGKIRLWTFTLPKLYSVPEACKMWSVLIKSLQRQLGFSGIRVFELHTNHGLHVHVLVNQYHSVHRVRYISQSLGWGRIHVCRCNSNPYYVAKYVAKGKRVLAFIGRRLWAGFGKNKKEFSRIKDCVSTSAKSQIAKSVENMDWLKAKRRSGGRLVGAGFRRWVMENGFGFDHWLQNGLVQGWPSVYRRPSPNLVYTETIIRGVL